MPTFKISYVKKRYKYDNSDVQQNVFDLETEVQKALESVMRNGEENSLARILVFGSKINTLKKIIKHKKITIFMT